jgi:hypothetical protein
MKRHNNLLPTYDLIMFGYSQGFIKNGQKFITKETDKPAQLIDGKLYWMDSEEPVEIINGVNCSETFIHFRKVD